MTLDADPPFNEKTPSSVRPPTPLAGLRVVEYATDTAGEMTGLQLVNMGARVTKVEPPQGAPSRHTGPFVDGVEDPERSLAFWYYNVGKQSVVLDLDTDFGRHGLDGVLADAEVFVSTLHPLELERNGIDLAQLSAANPALIVVSITPFGLTGPWKNYLSSDLVGMAASGLLITSGYDDHSIPPIRPGGDQTFHVAASFALMAILLALTERRKSGKGGLIDLSMHESAGLTVELANPFWFYPRVTVQRQTGRHAQPVPTQSAMFECGDGAYVYFALILSESKAWESLVEWMTSRDVAVDLVDEKYLSVAYRQEHFAHIQSVLECFFLLLSSSEAYHDGQARGLPIGVVKAPEDLYSDEHLLERKFFVAVDQPEYGEFLHPVSSLRFSSYSSATPSPAPSLGQHTPSELRT